VSQNTYQYRIGIVGPTRVGKTSLIASILKDAQRLLEGTPVRIEPGDTKTSRRLQKTQNELAGSLIARKFNPGAVSGTRESFEYSLKMGHELEPDALEFKILDFPGGWLDPSSRPENRAQAWQECLASLHQSTVLIIPVESTVLMEASTKRQQRHIPGTLTIAAVEEVARDWAKTQHALAQSSDTPSTPPLVIFSPIKCESYFSDNGGKRDLSNELFHRVRNTYASVIKAIQAEAPEADIFYAPVDTVGCVEVTRADWKDGHFSANYMVRGSSASQNIKGADAIVTKLCQHLFNLALMQKGDALGHLLKDSKRLRAYAEQEEGFFKDIWIRITGEREKRRENARSKEQEAEQTGQSVKTLEAALEKIASQDPYEARAKTLT
jgi:hypothetical protein